MAGSRRVVPFAYPKSDFAATPLGQVLLNEPGTEVDVHLDQRLVPDALEAVDLAGLDDQDVSGPRLELLSIDDIAAPPFSDELNLIIRMAMGTWPPAGVRPEQEHRDVDVALVRSDELMRAALEGEILLPNAMHADAILELKPHSRKNVPLIQVTDSETGTPRKRR